MKKIFVENNVEAISATLADVDCTLREWKIKDEERIKSTLALESLLLKISSTLPEGEKIMVKLSRSYRHTSIHTRYRGEQLHLPGSGSDADMNLLNDEYDPEAAVVISNLIQRFSSEFISESYFKGINRVRITVHRNEKAMIYDTAIALLLAIVTAIGIRLSMPTDIVTFFAENIYSPLYEIFIRAVLAVVGPMVFFSLAACIANLKDVSSLGRAGAKIMTCYLLTTVLAILMVLGFNAAFSPGAGTSITLHKTASMAANSSTTADTSILKMFIDIIPDNILGAFVHGDMLQLLFLGIAVGVACSGESSFSVKLRGGIDVMDHLMQKLIKYCVMIMPVAVFGAVGGLVCTLDMKMFGVVCTWFFATWLLMFLMLVVYQLLIAIFGRMKPVAFSRKFFEAQITALSTGSSCATIPITMKCCEKLGISPRLYNFSIPLGATVNMHGTSIYLTMTGLFLATLCGVHLSADTITTFIITVVMLSIAAPGVSGGGVAMLLIVLGSLGVPSSAATLVIGIVPFFEIVSTVTNVTGDAAVSLIVAKSEGLLDKDKYYEK